MKVLVGSVFADDSRTEKWYNLQIDYLKKTTEFKHVVYSVSKFKFPFSFVLGEKFNNAHDQHINGLNSLLDYFRISDFDYFLLLDSDCFPVQPWVEKLIKGMKGFDIAAPIRYENLDTFAHPSAFFFNRNALKTLKFGLNKCTNLLGYSYYETTSNIIKFFPLLRTNKVNKHPILFGIYWDIFYHHGAGSRAPLCRADNYYKNLNAINIENKNFNELVIDSEKFINELSNFKKVVKYV